MVGNPDHQFTVITEKVGIHSFITE